MEQAILNSAKGRFEFPLGDKVFKFYFTMRSFEIVFEKYNFFELVKNNDTLKAYNILIYAGLVGASNNNNLPEKFNILDFYDLLDELEPTNDQMMNIQIACLDSFGIMAKKSGKFNEIQILEIEESGKASADLMRKALQMSVIDFQVLNP